MHTNNFAIWFLMNELVTNVRVTRWFLLQQEFDITIVERLAKHNVVANFLSISPNNDDNILVEDSFLDEYFLTVSTYSPWYVDIYNYLVVGKLMYHLSPREK